MIGNSMATQRRLRKSALTLAAAVLGGAAALSGILASVSRSGAATTEYVVLDRNRGLAISGFDPIAYFTDGAAAQGKGDFEYRHAGAVWRFRNPGNRGAFAAHPDIYMPRFGGYDPVGVARGVGVPGDPRLWVIVEDRLYLFHSPDTKAAFAVGTGRAIAAADGKWPEVQATLSP